MRGARLLWGKARSQLRTQLRARSLFLGDRRQGRNKPFEPQDAPTAEKVADWGGVYGGDFPVFFLLGFAKSGTSWLTRTLNSHPDILCRGEGIFFGRGSDLGQRRGLLTPTSLYGALADSENLRGWFEGSFWTRDDDADRHLDNLTRIALRYVLAEKLSASGKRIIGDKTPFVSEEDIEHINTIIPEAKVVHIIRDGRDVAVSAMHHLWNHAVDVGGHLNIEPEELAKRDAYRRDPEAFVAGGESIFDEARLRTGFAKSWKSMTASAVVSGPALLGENYVEVRYEDLLERPVEKIQSLFEFLGVESGKDTARRCVEATSFEQMSQRKRGEEDSASFFRKGVAGDWKNVFTGRDRQIFKEVAGDLLIELGYEQDEDW
ncbi:MAG: sulfotransferase domain-containing protein [Rubrobacteraceae bacterium]